MTLVQKSEPMELATDLVGKKHWSTIPTRGRSGEMCGCEGFLFLQVRGKVGDASL